MTDSDPIAAAIQEASPLVAELAAPEPIAVEPVGDAAREMLSPKPENTIHQGEMTGSNVSEGKEVTSKQDDLVNKITWAQVGRVIEPGRYMFKFGWLTITTEDLLIWENYPTAAFTLTQTLNALGVTDEFRLGTFELRTDSNYSESEK